MPLPLHKDAQQTKKGTHFHAGLWYDRFFNQYDGDWQVADEGKLKWISTVTGSLIGDKDALKQAAERQDAIAKACGGQSLVMTTDWHFVTGLGNNHPVENGFAWHHTLGVPYLTGAAVKGMVRAWCEVWQGFDADQIKQWFGGKGDEQAGELIFFDAIPIERVQLKADIMTPHYGDWYAKGDKAPQIDGSNVPADWHDPVPVPFLVVDKGASFQFAVGKRAGSSVDLSEVTQALGEALQWLGAGAKTAAGYGRFSEDMQVKIKRVKQAQEAEAQAEMEAQAKASGLTGLALDMAMLIKEKGLENDKGAWIREAQGLVEQVESCEGEQEKQAAVQLLMGMCEKHDAGILDNPNKTKGKKNKPVYKANSISLAKSLLALKK